MSDTEKRDAVLEEFCPQRYRESPWQTIRKLAAEDMADEIVRLRAENVALTAERDRAERILAALREPSEGMMESVLEEYGPGQFVAFHRTRLVDALNAAVAAAEEEVGDA